LFKAAPFGAASGAVLNTGRQAARGTCGLAAGPRAPHARAGPIRNGRERTDQDSERRALAGQPVSEMAGVRHLVDLRKD
jgi:hypothetical protein